MDEKSNGENKPDGTSTFAMAPPRLGWREGLKEKAISFESHPDAPEDMTVGYRIVWYLWAADIWFGKFPLLKFILGVNVVIWIVWLLLLT